MQIFSTFQPDRDTVNDTGLLPRFALRSLPASDEAWKDRYIAFLTPEEVGRYKGMLNLPEFAVRECVNDIVQLPKIEAFEGLVYGILNRIEDGESSLAVEEIPFFMTPAGLVIVSESNTLMEKLQMLLVTERGEKPGSMILPEKVLFMLMEQIVASDMALIRKMDEEETLLEEKLLAGEKMDYPSLIFRFRQKTLFLEHYAGLMVDLMDILDENDSAILRPESVRMFTLIGARLARMERSAESLRESVMQLREAYQSQVDIDANQMMKLFTIVSTIFLPLTVITGWFGMNFRNMPELEWAFGYPVVIFASASVTAGIIWFCKKKKFF